MYALKPDTQSFCWSSQFFSSCWVGKRVAGSGKQPAGPASSASGRSGVNALLKIENPPADCTVRVESARAACLDETADPGGAAVGRGGSEHRGRRRETIDSDWRWKTNAPQRPGSPH
ncbi:hypothetical protein DIPPA_32015 [Diplonema papillatum]|nr:hypothetical protein DIPPA_32015 [Diplonema papillatum]